MKWPPKHPVLLTLLGVAGFLLLGLAYLVLFPSWVLKPFVLKKATEILASKGIHIEHQIEEGSLSWEGFGNLRVRLEASHFCLRNESVPEMCLNGVRVDALLDVLPPEIALLGVRTLHVREGSLAIRNTQSPEATPESEEPGFSLPAWVSRLGDIRVQQFQFSIVGPSGNETRGNASISCDPKAEDKLGCEGALTLALVEKDKKTNLRLSFNIVKPRDRLAGDIQAKLTLRDPSVPLRHAEVDGYLANEEDSLSFTGNLSADGPVPIRLGVKGCRVSGLKGDTLGVEDCKLSPVVKTVKGIEVAMDLTLNASINLNERKGEVVLEIGSASAKSLIASGKIAGSFSPCDGGIALDMDDSSQLHIELKRYQDVVDTLRNTYWAIPAPVNVLRGNLSVDINSLKRQGDKLVAPVTLRTDLQSPSQKLAINANGVFRLGACIPQGGYELDLEAVLEKAAFDLPPLSLAKPPPMVPDSRIGAPPPTMAREKVDKKSEPAFPYHIRIRTAEKSPVRLGTNLTKEPIRVETNIELSSSRPPDGYIRVLPLELELFRREATIRNFRATLLKEGRNETVLDIEGVLNVNYPDYSVDIKISGTSASPRIHMQSSPPLSQREIIALLLFGEVPSGLDFDQNQSIQNMDAALAERSIGLASLYFFAKTPIQSVSYNPDTNNVTVRVRLGEKTVISASSDESGPSKIGLRRRIGKHWAISTELDLDEAGKSTPMSSFLEWFTRY